MNPVPDPSSFSTFPSTNFDPSFQSSAPGLDNSNPFVPPALPADLFGDPSGFGFLDNDFVDSAESKRRRITRACDKCRAKKIRCDAKAPKCTNCENYKTECIFTHVEKKRNPPKGAKYIEGLENRLGRMENLLKMSGLLSQEDLTATDLNTIEQRLAKRTSSPQDSSTESRKNSLKAASNAPTPPQSGSMITPPGTVGSPSAQSMSLADESRKDDPSDEHELNKLSDMMCTLMTNSAGETRFLGSSSGFSMFSPRGMQWVAEKSGDTTFPARMVQKASQDNKWINWRPEVFNDVFARPIYQSLPSREEGMDLIQEFLTSINRVLPLFHTPTFLWLAEKQWSDEPYESAGWWASLNSALALGHRVRVMKNLNKGDDDDKAWAYMKNALPLVGELTLRGTDLLSVQALLVMAVFMEATPNPQPSFSLVGAAIRLSHSIGLHKRVSPEFGLTDTEAEQRKRVFWIAYMIDKDISLRSGRPPVQDDLDWNVELPSHEPGDNVGVVITNDGVKANYFRLMCEFSTISSRVYSRLYTVQAAKKSDGELLNTIGELDEELEAWKNRIPLEFRPEHEPNVSDQELVLQIVNIHFAYYNCVMTIHRMSVHHGYWSNRLSEYAINGLNARSLNPRVYSSALLCVQAARASINLLKYIPQGDYACVWLFLYYPVSSMMTLFANILQNPQDARARADLKLIGLVVSFMSTLSLDETTGNLQRMAGVTREIEKIAVAVLNKADREMTARQKRKQAFEKEKVQASSTEPVRAMACGTGKTRENSQSGRGENRSGSEQARNFSSMANPNNNVNFGAAPNTSKTLDSQQLPSTSRSNNPFLPNTTTPFFPTNHSDLSDYMSNDFGELAHTASLTPSSSTRSGNQSLATPTSSDTLNQTTSNASGASRTGGASTFAKDDSVNPGGNSSGGMFGDGTDFSSLAFDTTSFQQPFVPQEMWSMPMTFQWDWADMLNSNAFAGDDNDQSGGMDTAGAGTGRGNGE